MITPSVVIMDCLFFFSPARVCVPILDSILCLLWPGCVRPATGLWLPPLDGLRYDFVHGLDAHPLWQLLSANLPPSAEQGKRNAGTQHRCRERGVDEKQWKESRLI